MKQAFSFRFGDIYDNFVNQKEVKMALKYPKLVHKN